jgi:ribosomal subunit interface protein
MRLGIRSQKLDISEAVREAIERRLRFVLGRYGNQVGRVSVRLDAPRITCRIEVQLQESGTVVVDDADDDVATVVDRAADRVAKAVQREMERRRDNGVMPARTKGEQVR